MNEIKPTIGFELTNNYDEAKKKVVELVLALQKLSPEQNQRLALECISSMTAAVSFEQFIDNLYRSRHQ